MSLIISNFGSMSEKICMELYKRWSKCSGSESSVEGSERGSHVQAPWTWPAIRCSVFYYSNKKNKNTVKRGMSPCLMRQLFFVSLFFTFTTVKLKGLNKQLHKKKYIYFGFTLCRWWAWWKTQYKWTSTVNKLHFSTSGRRLSTSIIKMKMCQRQL